MGLQHNEKLLFREHFVAVVFLAKSIVGIFQLELGRCSVGRVSDRKARSNMMAFDSTVRTIYFVVGVV